LRDLIPGLIFVEPSWLERLFGPHQGVLEAGFWTLFVEVKFYLIAGLLYFTVGLKGSLAILILLFFSSVIVNSFELAIPWLDSVRQTLQKSLMVSSAEYYGWFAAGALSYRFLCERKKALLFGALLIGMSAALITPGWGSKLAALGVVALFAIPMLSATARSALSSPILVFMGFVSYPLYLLNENIMVSMIVKTWCVVPSMPAILIPVVPILFVTLLAWLVARFAEPWVRRLFAGTLHRPLHPVASQGIVTAAPFQLTSPASAQDCGDDQLRLYSVCISRRLQNQAGP
jgi:peptidoglycan/LPS O-acetylase OafA/YrhL